MDCFTNYRTSLWMTELIKEVKYDKEQVGPMRESNSNLKFILVLVMVKQNSWANLVFFQNNVWSKNIYVQTISDPKKSRSKIILGQNKFLVKEIWGLKESNPQNQ